MLLQVPSHDLHQILSDTAPFAHQSPDIPAINCVLVHFDGTNLVGVATDRFKLAVSRVKVYTPEGEPQPTAFKATIRLDEVSMLVKHLKTPPGLRTIRTVTIDDAGGGNVGVADALAPNMFSLTTMSSAQLSIKVAQTDAPFPNWKHLLTVYPDADGSVVGIALDPFHLAPFFKVATTRREHRVQLRFRGLAKPVLVRVGEDFAGLVMPIRMEAATWDHPDWLAAMLGTEAPAK